MCISMSTEVPETPELDNQSQSQVISQVVDETLVSDGQELDQIMDDKLEPESEQCCFNRYQTLVSEHVLDETLVSEPVMTIDSVIDQTLGGDELAGDQSLSDENILGQIKGGELGPEWVQSCEETSSEEEEALVDFCSVFKSSSSSKEEDCSALVEFSSAMTQDAESPDEVEEDCYMNGMPFHMWQRRRGFPYEPQFLRHHMWDMDCRLYPFRFRSNPISFLPALGNESESKKEANTFSSFQSNLDEINPAMVGAGLWNLGNTCFLNAILQCFTHTVPLIEGLRSYNHPKPCQNDSEGFCIFCALHEHIELAITSKGKSLSPLEIVENLNQLSSDFRRHQQEDAHELLQCLLDKLDRCCNNLSADDSNASLVNRLFGGRLVSKLKCCSCGHCSDTFEPLIDLSLEIENMSSLTSALESFTKVEKIEDEEPQFTCEGCKEKVAVEKQLMVDHAPSIAAFHLKRFKNNGSYVEKIDKHVAFPLELDLKPYTIGCQNDNVDLNYNLYAIVEHAGFSPTSGHYFCFIQSAPNTWYRLDDSQVTRVFESHVLSRDAYILFYVKKGTSWFSTFMETEKLHMDSIVSTTSPKSVLETSNQSSESSPTRASNMISEVYEDQKQGMEIPGSCSKTSACEGVVEAKNSCEVEKTSPSRDGSSVISNTSSLSINQISESSLNMETNISTHVNDGDRKDAMEIFGLSSNNFVHEGVAEAKNDSKVGGGISVTTISSPKSILDIDQISESFLNMENNISTDVNGDRRRDMEISGLSFDICRYKDEVEEAKDDADNMKLWSPGATIGDTLVINNSLPKSFIDTDHISDSSSSIKANTTDNLNGENRGDAMDVSRLPVEDLVNKAKDDSKIETGLLSALLRGGDSSNEENVEFTRNADLKSSTSLRSLTHIGISKLSFDGCTLEDSANMSMDDSEVEKKLSPSLKGEVGKSDAVDSSTIPGFVFSAKPCANPKDQVMKNRETPRILRLSNDRQRKVACKLVKGRPCSRRRSQLMAAVNNKLRSFPKTNRKIIKSPRRPPFAP